jgi:hypothetical protein
MAALPFAIFFTWLMKVSAPIERCRRVLRSFP